MEWHLPALPFDLHPLITEAKRRARRRRVVLAALAPALAGVALGAALTAGAGGSPGVVPWLPTRPYLGPAHPALAAPCEASQLRATLELQGETAAGLGGPIAVENRSAQPCALVGRPNLSFAGATAKWRATRLTDSSFLPFDPLAPPSGSLRALAPGRWAYVDVFWSNWCGRGSSPTDSRPGRPPAAIVLAAPGGGEVALTENRPGRTPFPLAAPPCLDPSVSTLGATRFAPYLPQLGPSSELPLRARFGSGAEIVVKGKSIELPGSVVRPGSWHSFTVVLTNTGRHPFRFGRTCPAYTEQIDAYPAQAYILNCRSVGAIAPGKSARFAMRIVVPRSVATTHPASLGWTLAPHTWNAPQPPPAILEVVR